RRGAGIEGDSMVRAAVAGKAGLEALDRLTKHVVAAAQGIQHHSFEFVADRGILCTQIEKWDHEAFLKVPSSTGWPRMVVEFAAAARVSTTRRPLSPSEGGLTPVSTARTNCSISVTSASFAEMAGAHMSPMR